MSKTSLRFALLISGFLVLSVRTFGPGVDYRSISEQEKGGQSDNLAFSVSDHNETHAFLSSSKEDITSQYSQHKIKLYIAHSFTGIKLNYRYTHILYQSVLAHSYILGSTSALRAPPSYLFS